uniref:glucuronosyltransferase n=1 Tax=Parascaris univalens TaxID=6257 RepID=A0A915CCQ7_PARUN
MGVLLLCAFSLFIVSVDTSEILVGVMTQGKSHTGSFMPLLEELKGQGHNVTLFMDSYVNISFGNKVNEWFIKITGHQNPMEETGTAVRIWKDRFTFVTQTIPFYFGARSCEYVLEDHRDEFYRLVNYRWDLILTDSLFAVCSYGIAELSEAHHVIMHSTDVESGAGTAKGFARNFIMMPRYFLDFDHAEYDITRFMQRFWSAYEWLGTWTTMKILTNRHMRKALSPIVPWFDITRYYADSSMSFTDMPLILYFPMATSNELFIYGAYCRPSKALTAEFSTFVDDQSSSGTILIAFGTIVDWARAPTERLDTFVAALNELSEYRIIWSYGGPEIRVKKHIKVVRWLPQNDILNDNRTKLFITHGGLKSVKETTCAAVPALLMPMFGEQVRNSWLTYHHGFGRIINKVNFTSASLIDSIREMATNPVYKNNVKRLRKFYEDAPIPALKEAAFKINRLLKYGGRMPEYFYTRSTKFSFFTSLNIDLLVLYPFILLLLLLIK